MQEMHFRTRLAHEFDVTLQHQHLGDCRPTGQSETRRTTALVHDCPVGEPRHFAVLRESHVELAGMLESSTHDQRVLDTIPVVREHSDTRRRHRVERRQLASGTPNGDAARRSHRHKAGTLTLQANEFDDGHVVLGRVGVRHRDTCAEPAERGRERCRGNGFGLFTTRLSHVRVQVDERTGDETAGGIESHRPAVRSGGQIPVETLTDLNDATTIDQHIGCFVTVSVDHEPTGDQQRLHLLIHSFPHPLTSSRPAPNIENNTAIRTAIPFVT